MEDEKLPESTPPLSKLDEAVAFWKSLGIKAVTGDKSGQSFSMTLRKPPAATKNPSVKQEVEK